MTNTDNKFIEQALQLATTNVKQGGGPFGAVIVKDGKVVGTGQNSVTVINDPTAHAEVMAIREACKKLNNFNLEGCVIYSSCEPCPMCMASCLWARLDRVTFAADRYQAAEVGFDDLAFYKLFEEIPVSKWETPVEHIKVDNPIAPFTAWNENEDKVEY
ncbi:MAG: nucleoside deaminase [Micrococcaceae bacterium]